MSNSEWNVMSYEDLVDAYRQSAPEQQPPATMPPGFLRGLGEFALDLTPIPALGRQAGKLARSLTGRMEPATWDDFLDFATLGLWAVPPAAVLSRAFVPTSAGVTAARRKMEKGFEPAARDARKFAEEHLSALGNAPNFGLANIISRAERNFNDPVRVPWGGLWAPGMEELLARYGRLFYVTDPRLPVGRASSGKNPATDPVLRRDPFKHWTETTYHGAPRSMRPGDPVLSSLGAFVQINKPKAMSAVGSGMPVRWGIQGPLHVAGHEVGHLMDVTSGLVRGARHPVINVPFRSLGTMPVGSRAYENVFDFARFVNPKRYDPALQTTHPAFYYYVRSPDELAAEALREALIRPRQVPSAVRSAVDDLLVDSANVNRVALPWW